MNSVAVIGNGSTLILAASGSKVMFHGSKEIADKNENCSVLIDCNDRVVESGSSDITTRRKYFEDRNGNCSVIVDRNETISINRGDKRAKATPSCHVSRKRESPSSSTNQEIKRSKTDEK